MIGPPSMDLRQEHSVQSQMERPWVLNKKGGIDAKWMDLRNALSGGSGQKKYESFKHQVLGCNMT